MQMQVFFAITQVQTKRKEIKKKRRKIENLFEKKKKRIKKIGRNLRKLWYVWLIDVTTGAQGTIKIPKVAKP